MHAAVHRLLLACLPLFAGCTTLDFNLADFRRDVDQTAGVADVVCLWEAAEGVGLDGLPTRGFAGQVLFFVKGHAEPVKVNGDVRIYVFDDQGTTEEQSRPLHEFNFPADAWNTYLAQTNLGKAYQIFIPYTRKGGMRANCAIRVRITPPDRKPVYSKLANVAVPGRMDPVKATATATAAVAVPADPSYDTLNQLVQDAAIHQTSAQMGVRNPVSQLHRLQQAAESAVQTADYNASAEEQAESAHFESEVTSSRRYRMSGAVESP